jgi:hypothetical protein
MKEEIVPGFPPLATNIETLSCISYPNLQFLSKGLSEQLNQVMEQLNGV